MAAECLVQQGFFPRVEGGELALADGFEALGFGINFLLSCVAIDHAVSAQQSTAHLWAFMKALSRAVHARLIGDVGYGTGKSATCTPMKPTLMPAALNTRVALPFSTSNANALMMGTNMRHKYRTATAA